MVHHILIFSKLKEIRDQRDWESDERGMGRKMRAQKGESCEKDGEKGVETETARYI